jgi:hypothetical protein
MKDSTKDGIVGLTLATFLISATAFFVWFGWRRIGAILFILAALLVGGLWEWLRKKMWRDVLKPRR